MRLGAGHAQVVTVAARRLNASAGGHHMTIAAKRIAMLRTGVALTVLMWSASAYAGGFAVREQSTIGQGASFAGVAAGGAPSSMFWNPATMTQFPGKTMEMGGAFILPRSSQGGTSGSAGLNALGFTKGTDNSAESALVPNSYTVWQFSPNIWLGVSSNSPFGLSVGFPNSAWAGAGYAQSTTLKTYNAAPSIAIKVNDWISLGAGVQIQYATANLASFNGAVGPVTPNLLLISGSGWGWGWTAGVTLTPFAGTQIGVGYRSAINQDIDGSLTVGPGGTPGSVSTTLNLPDVLTVGIRQRINAQFTVLGGFEWSNWSRIGTTNILQPNGSLALSSSGTGITLPFQYSDGYFYSGGFEYVLTPAWTMRAGFAFEKSPITDQVRTPRLPDNDRYWYSFGLTNTVTSRLSIDLAYSFIDVKETPINISATSGNPWFNPAIGSYIGTASSHVNILSLSIRYRSDTPPAPVGAKG
jgi:long-chain fatty acid transport protein